MVLVCVIRQGVVCLCEWIHFRKLRCAVHRIGMSCGLVFAVSFQHDVGTTFCINFDKIRTVSLMDKIYCVDRSMLGAPSQDLH